MRDIKICSPLMSYASWLSNFFNIEFVNNINEADLLVLPGGADINPEIYGESIGSKTYINKEADSVHTALFTVAFERKIPILGICRGAQLGCGLSGGKIIQHVENHAGRMHNLRVEVDVNGKQVKDGPYNMDITSTHHQMMYPFNMNPKDYVLMAYPSKGILSETHLNGEDKEIDLPDNFVEPEIVYFKKTKCLAVQGHPEHMNVRQYPIVPFIADQIKLMLDMKDE